MGILGRLFKTQRERARLYAIGPHEIYLPPGHRLAEFQRKCPRYDYILGEIARIVFQHVPPALGAIDIGANIGDSAALINKHLTVPTLCVEGLPEFLAILEQNRRILGEHVQVASVFIGTGSESVAIDEKSTGGTFSPLSGPKGDRVATLTLRQVLEQNPAFAEAKLIKIDTDGFDFRILQNSIDVIGEMKPVVFFEYDICFERDGEQQAEAAIASLEGAGYDKFLVYDNFGNLLISLEGGEKFKDLNLYLLSNSYHARQIYYYDVCAFPGTEQGAAIHADVLAFENGQRETYLSKLRR